MSRVCHWKSKKDLSNSSYFSGDPNIRIVDISTITQKPMTLPEPEYVDRSRDKDPINITSYESSTENDTKAVVLETEDCDPLLPSENIFQPWPLPSTSALIDVTSDSDIDSDPSSDDQSDYEESMDDRYNHRNLPDNPNTYIQGSKSKSHQSDSPTVIAIGTKSNSSLTLINSCRKRCSTTKTTSSVSNKDSEPVRLSTKERGPPRKRVSGIHYDYKSDDSLPPEPVSTKRCSRKEKTALGVGLQVQDSFYSAAFQLKQCYVRLERIDLKTSTVTLKPETRETSLRCKYCRRTYADRIVLNVHVIRKHLKLTNYDTFSCDICTSVLSCFEALRDHLCSFHFESTKIESKACTFCQKTCHGIYRTVRVKNVTIQVCDTFQCCRCDKVMPSHKSMQGHIAAAHFQTVYKCAKCSQTFNKHSSFLSHMLTHATDVHECSICKQRFKHLRALQRHILRHAKGNSCSKCKTLCKLQYLTDHNMLCALCFHSGKAKIGHVARRRRKKYKKREQTSLEANSSSKSICDICKIVLPSNISLLEHIKYVHIF